MKQHKNVQYAYIQQTVWFDSREIKEKYFKKWKQRSHNRLIVVKEWEMDDKHYVIVRKPYNKTQMYEGEIINVFEESEVTDDTTGLERKEA